MTSARRGSRAIKKNKKQAVVNGKSSGKPAPAKASTVAVVPDSDVFVVDRNPSAVAPEVVTVQYTKKQQAALEKFSKITSNDEPIALPIPKAPQVKKLEKLKRPVAQKVQVKSKQSKKSDDYDLWEKDFTPKVDLPVEAAAEHFLRIVKKKLPGIPSTMKHIPSLLSAVALPEGGASYNPTADDYHEYVSKIAEEELSVIKKEERISAAVKPKTEAMATSRERYLEQTEGLVIDPRYNDDENDDRPGVSSESTEEPRGEVKLAKRKTTKQRKTAERVKKEERLRIQKKEAEKHQHDVYKARNINKRLAAQEEQTNKKAVERRKQKVIDKLTKRQQLGRGDFEEEEAPFLLEDELSGNLRQLKPQGSVLTDRMKSLQRRNILPISGEKNKRKLAKRLKVKYVEKRATRDYGKGGRVI